MKVLDSVRVLEIGGLGPGPFCAMHLADLGADVIKVDKKAQTLTLRGVERKVTLKVKDAEQLNAVEKGDQVEGVYADAVAIAVEPAPRKKPQATQPQ